MFDIAGVAKPKNMENNECGDVCVAAGAESVAVQNVLIEKLADRIVRVTISFAHDEITRLSWDSCSA